jgi:hypothetical protein
MRFRSRLALVCVLPLLLAARPPGPPGVLVFAEGTLLGFTATVEGPELRVHGEASVMDRRGAVRYLWVLQVRRQPEDEEVVRLVYARRAFRVHPRGGPRRVTFDEVLQPGPGRHLVHLWLLNVPDGQDPDLATMSEDELILNHMTVRGVEFVDVAR